VAPPERYRLGTIEASEALLSDLYVALRRAVANWAAVTNQTPQARMGYVGQHLTSVVTGFPGGRSGARGKDLVLPGGKYAEIKTCYRVDQLGACRVCSHAVASIELECPNCGGTAIDRKDDSKWLISPRSEAELHALWDAESFYFVLFDFADFADPREINARIWRVDPRSAGFAYCMVDYFFTIRAESISGAPFNLWPFSFKFGLLGGELIYSARIHEDDSIETFLFPGVRGEAEPIRLGPLTEYARSRGMTSEALQQAASDAGVTLLSHDRPSMIAAVQAAREAGAVDEETLRDSIAAHVYLPRMRKFREHLPPELS
jgi:predicted RNA-binding Zn-ribbon protein involved in translation (DUF1610 family)